MFTCKAPRSTIQDLQHRLQQHQSSKLHTDKQDIIHFPNTTATPSQFVKNYTVITVNKSTISDDPFLLAFNLSKNTTVPDAITSPNGLYKLALETVPSSEIPLQCTSGWDASRLFSQFGTVFRGGQLLYKHTLKTGHDYDYVLRLRPDTYLPASPPWKATDAGAGARLIMPHPRVDRAKHHYYYSTSPQGDVVVGATDQVSYGPKQLMLTLFDLYLHFRSNLANGKEEVAYRDFSGCHVLSAGAEAKDCPWKQLCSPECHTTHWLASRGVHWETDWDWGHYPCKKGWYVEGDPSFCDYEQP